jgi:peptide/nickel transport system permease protein
MGVRVIFRRLARSPLSLVGLVIVTGMVLVALLAPWIAPHDPVKPNVKDRLQPPSAQYLFGTDKIGRDVFSRVVHGTRISLRVGVMVVGIAFPVGTVLGVVAAYYGGQLDNLIMRLTDVFLAIPSLVLAMAIAAALGPSIQNVLLALAVVWWPWYTRIVRSLALQVRESEYVLAARSVGAGDLRILFRHILPNSIGPAIVTATLDIGFVILSAAGLSFIGLGAQPPSPEWGAMLASAREILREAWWAATFPGLAIFITVLGFNLLGDGFRDATDPILKGR